MNCVNSVLFAKMDKVFSEKKQNIKIIVENGEKMWKSRGCCQSRKVGRHALLGIEVHR